MDKVAKQSVPAGKVIAWEQSVTYSYGTTKHELPNRSEPVRCAVRVALRHLRG
jgi:hypothetical protein